MLRGGWQLRLMKRFNSSIHVVDATMRRLGSLDERTLMLGFLALVGLIEIALYAVHPQSPLRQPTSNWNGWWDQSQYLKSATAFAHGKLAASEHWYLPGYALLGAPFVWLLPQNPFLPVNLISLELFTGAFMLYFRQALGFWLSAAMLLLGLLVPLHIQDPFNGWTPIWNQFAIPWNTVPVASAFMIVILLVRDSTTPGHIGRDFILGLCAALVAACRPIDVIPLIPAGLLYLQRRLLIARSIKGVGTGLVGIALVAVPFVLLLYAIYGGLNPPYVEQSKAIGFGFSNLFDRAVSMLVDARSTYGYPTLLDLQPWLAFSVPLALVLAWVRPKDRLLPVVMIATSIVTYLSYNDFWPQNLLLFRTIHYITWVLPILAACGMAGLVTLLKTRCYVLLSVAGLVVPLALASYRVAIIPLSPRALTIDAPSPNRERYRLSFTTAEHVNAVDFIGATAPDSLGLTVHTFDIRADGRRLGPQSGYRAIALAKGVRIIFSQKIVATTLTIVLDNAVRNKPKIARKVVPLAFGSRWMVPFFWLVQRADPQGYLRR